MFKVVGTLFLKKKKILFRSLKNSIRNFNTKKSKFPFS